MAVIRPGLRDSMTMLLTRAAQELQKDAEVWTDGSADDPVIAQWSLLAPSRMNHYAVEYSSTDTPLRRELVRETAARFGTLMLTGPAEGAFLRLLVQSIGANRVLEIGTFTGYGTLWLAEGVGPDGTVFTCEIDPEPIEIAKRYFEKSGFADRIRLLEGPALESIARIDGSFDLVFVDADKKQYPDYWNAVASRVRKGGLVVFDNATHFLGPITGDSGFEPVNRCNQLVRDDPRYEQVLLLVRDGVMIARRT